MTVVLNPAGIELLFKSAPVTAFTERVAGRVVENARSNVRGYFHSAPSLNVDQDIGQALRGEGVVVGIRDAGHKARLLAQYQSRGNSNGVVDWLLEAVNQTRDDFGT